MIAHVAFVRPIWILGTSKREDQFRAVDGWLIEASDVGILLHRPAQQNVPEVPRFGVVGVGYSIGGELPAPEPPPPVIAPEPVTYVRKGKR